jgi:hypothetical protein
LNVILTSVETALKTLNTEKIGRDGQ